MRNVENQPVIIALDKGMDQSRSDRTSPPGTLSLVKNCRIRSGQLRKRCGSESVSSSTVFGSAHRISDSVSEPRPVEHPAFVARIQNQRAAGTSAGDVFVRDAAAIEWIYQGSFSAAAPVRKRLGLPPYDATHVAGPYVPACAATSDGYICTASAFGNQLRITVESPDGTLIFRSSPLQVGSTGVIVRVVAIGANFFICYQDVASTTVERRHLTVSGGTVGGTGTATLVTLNNAASTWDVSGYDDSSWFLVYQSGATTVTVSERDTSATQTTSVTFATTNNLTYLSVWADTVADHVWIGFVDDPAGTASAQFRVYNDNLVASLGPTTLASGGTYGAPLFGPRYTRAPGSGDAFYVFSSVSAAGPVALMSGTVANGTATTPIAAAWNFVPIGKPDVQQRVWAMSHLVSNFTTVRVCLLRVADASSLNSIGGPTPIVELASPEFETAGALYHPAAARGVAFHAAAVTSEDAGGSTFFALPIVLTSRTNASGATEPTVRVDVYEYTRWNQEPHRQVAGIGRARIVAGQPTELFGMPENTSLASTGAVEVGFAHGPSIFSAVATPSGGGLAAGSYVYQAIQHWVDDEGNRQLSPASDPVTVTLTVPSSVALKISNCYVGQRTRATTTLAGASPETLIYRTQAGGTDAQQVPVAPAEPGAAWAGYVTATDTVADSIIDENEFIYTAGGVLPNVLAPSCRYIAVSEERLWCGGLWDSNIIECSKTRIPGEPYNFTGDPSHQVVIPGEVSGLAYMDGQVCVFTEDAIYLVSGDGPNDQGAGGFPAPRALVRGIGCPREQSASILETEAGILFRSTLGFYVIPRGYGTPQYIGEMVQDEETIVLSSAATTTSEHRLARFLVCSSGETKGDTVLTLDLTSMQWVRDEYQVNGSITGQGFSEIGEWPDGLALFSYGLQRTDNLSIIWAENESLTGDAGAAGAGATTFISQYIQTAWQYGNWGPMGRGRIESVVLMFVAAGACGLNLTVEAGDDGSDVAYAQNATQWTIAASSDDQYRYLTVKFPECSAYRITLYDAATSGNGAGLQLLGIGAMPINSGGMRPSLNSTERQ